MNICRIKGNVLYSLNEKKLEKLSYEMKTTDGISLEDFKTKAKNILQEQGEVFILTDRTKTSVVAYEFFERKVHCLDEFEKTPEQVEPEKTKKGSSLDEDAMTIYSLFKGKNAAADNAENASSESEEDKKKKNVLERMSKSFEEFSSKEFKFGKDSKEQEEKLNLKENEFLAMELTEFVEPSAEILEREKVLEELEKQVLGYLRTYTSNREIKGIIYRDFVFFRKNVFNPSITCAYFCLGIAFGFLMGYVMKNVGVGFLWFVVFFNFGWAFYSSGKEYRFKKNSVE